MQHGTCIGRLQTLRPRDAAGSQGTHREELAMKHRCSAYTVTVGALLLFVMGFGCAGPVRSIPLSDLETHPVSSDNESVRIVVSSLDALFTHYEMLKGRSLEISAPATYYGRKGYWTWYLLLEDNRQSLRCYTHHYRLYADRFAVLLLKNAMRAQAPITVVGTLYDDGLDLEQIMYNGQLVRTDIMPEMFYPFPWGRYYW